MDETLAEAHASLGFVKCAEYDWPGGERELKRAFELNPNYANTHYYYAFSYLAPMGRLDEAITEMQKALELDPLNLGVNANLGYIYYLARRYDQALEQYRRTIEMEPSFPMIHAHLGTLYEDLRKYEEAIGERSKQLPLLGLDRDKAAADITAIRKALAASGEKGYWRKVLEIQEDVFPGASSHDFRTRIYARLGEKEQVLKWLERGYQQRRPFVQFCKLDPAFDPLHADPRFQELLHGMGLPP